MGRDLFAQLQNLKQQGASIPKFYVACGLEDTLHEMNTRFRDLAHANSIPLTYEEGPGDIRGISGINISAGHSIGSIRT